MIKIKALSLFQGNPQSSDQKPDYEMAFTKQTSTYTWDVVQALESAPPAQTVNQEETKDLEKRSNSQQVVLYCLGLRTQNQGLREVDLEPSPKRGRDKINRLKS